MTRSTPHRPAQAGFSLLEVCFAMLFAAVMAVSLIQCLLQNERYAASSRVLTNARMVVQRNINACAGIAFSGTASTPALLALTASGGEVCSDDGVDGVTTQTVQIGGTGSVATVSGTLRRIVTSEPVTVSGTAVNSSVVVRRITFQIDYDYLSRHYTYSETTLRSADSQ